MDELTWVKLAGPPEQLLKRGGAKQFVGEVDCLVDESRKVDVQGFEFSGLTVKTRNLPLMEKELVSDAVLGERDMRRRNAWVERGHRELAGPVTLQRVPERSRYGTTNMESPAAQDEAVPLGEKFGELVRKMPQRGMLSGSGAGPCDAVNQHRTGSP